MIWRVVDLAAPSLIPSSAAGRPSVVAEELGCTGIGIDLNDNYLEIAKQRILEARTKRNRLTCVPISPSIADADAPAILCGKKPKKRRATRPTMPTPTANVTRREKSSLWFAR